MSEHWKWTFERHIAVSLSVLYVSFVFEHQLFCCQKNSILYTHGARVLHTARSDIISVTCRTDQKGETNDTDGHFWHLMIQLRVQSSNGTANGYAYIQTNPGDFEFQAIKGPVLPLSIHRRSSRLSVG